MMFIRKADITEIKGITELYGKVLTEEENGRAATGWIRGVYPTEETVKEGISSGDMFVAEENGKITAAARINRIPAPVYNKACWKYSTDDENKVMVLHTLAVSPDCAGRGIGSKFVKFYEDYAFSNGCNFLRMDTNEKNTNARRLYKKLGYREADILPCTFNGIKGVRLVCLEKLINKR
ncbi:MAG: GNAT family N-acetyltransferase [Acutalibacteraceae bacterium]|nr:GNAT family N-acetyltransferase [Clostridia bacterium]MEE1330678.1 GNAT family N-acetyltransferase [Acutalibacteraceae bacterium]